MNGIDKGKEELLIASWLQRALSVYLLEGVDVLAVGATMKLALLEQLAHIAKERRRHVRL